MRPCPGASLPTQRPSWASHGAGCGRNVGRTVTDAAGAIHPGIIRTPVPVLSGRPETFQTLRRQLAELEFADVAAVDFTDLAQSCRTYGEFIEKIARTGPGELRYLAWPFWAPGIRWTG